MSIVEYEGRPVARTSTSVVPPGEWALMQQQAEMLASSSIIPKAYQRAPANVVVAAMTGRQYGWDALTAMRQGHVIEGQWAMKPEAMLGLVRRAGHSVSIERGADFAEATGKRGDTGDTMSVRFSVADAKRAGLGNKNTWKNYPVDMCQWRAVGQLCRGLFGDITAGIYSAEELGADITAEGDIIDAEVYDEPDPDPPLSEENRAKFDEACKQYDLDPEHVIMTALAGEVRPLMTSDLPALRDAHREMVVANQEQAQDVGDDDPPVVVDGDGEEQKAPASPPPAPPVTPDDEVRPGTKYQARKVGIVYGELGVKDRDAKLAYSAKLLGVDKLGSHNDLNHDQFEELIEKLEHERDRDPHDPEALTLDVGA